MQILGIRNSPNEIRYAAVEWDAENAVLVKADCFNVVSFKTNKISGRETRVSAFTKNRISTNDKYALLQSFMLKVVEG